MKAMRKQALAERDKLVKLRQRGAPAAEVKAQEKVEQELLDTLMRLTAEEYVPTPEEEDRVRGDRTKHMGNEYTDEEMEEIIRKRRADAKAYEDSKDGGRKSAAEAKKKTGNSSKDGVFRGGNYRADDGRPRTMGKFGLCFICGKMTELKCSNCYNAFFCTAKCQTTGWGAHKAECKELKKKKKAEKAQREKWRRDEELNMRWVNPEGVKDLFEVMRGPCSRQSFLNGEYHTCECPGFVQKYGTPESMNDGQYLDCMRCGCPGGNHDNMMEVFDYTTITAGEVRRRRHDSPNSFRKDSKLYPRQRHGNAQICKAPDPPKLPYAKGMSSSYYYAMKHKSLTADAEVDFDTTPQRIDDPATAAGKAGAAGGSTGAAAAGKSKTDSEYYYAHREPDVVIDALPQRIDDSAATKGPVAVELGAVAAAIAHDAQMSGIRRPVPPPPPMKGALPTAPSSRAAGETEADEALDPSEVGITAFLRAGGTFAEFAEAKKAADKAKAEEAAAAAEAPAAGGAGESPAES